MSVVTIRGQLGSGAPEVGRQVADRLHIDYVDREIIAEVAKRLRWARPDDVAAKEIPPNTLLGRIAEALGRGYAAGNVYLGVSLPTWEIPLGDTRYLAGLEAVLRELAGSQSLVIRGRGSQLILRDYPGAFHVLVVAPLGVRVKRVMADLKLDEPEAKKEIARFDGSHREFIKRYFQAEVENPVYYDLVINTEHLTFEAATTVIVNALLFKEGAAGEQATAD